jgi:(p)ppGpp synthase/HD superfamily hydrolase
MSNDGIPRPLGPQFLEAIGYAARLHANQARKGTDRPYIGHLLGVTALVLRYGGDEEQAIAALLHDAAEDQGGRATLEAIRGKYGTRVAHIVEACTDSMEIPKPAWLARKRSYVEHVRHASHEVVLVSAADKLYNVREILYDYRAGGEKLWSRFSGGREGVLWYYRALVNAFTESLQQDIAAPSPVHAIIAELGRAVAELEQLVEVPRP